MPKKRNQVLMESLALHAAMGGHARTWAAENGIQPRTALEWLRLPECRVLVREHRGRVVDQVVGLHTAAALKATGRLIKLLDSEAEGIVLAAAKDLRDRMMDMATAADLERRLEALEARLEADGQGVAS